MSLLNEREVIIFNEMMSHPALYTHPKPENIGIIGDETQGILQEIQKHHTVKQVHPLTPNHITDDNIAPNSLDVLIILNSKIAPDYAAYEKVLHHNGILIHAGESFFQTEILKNLQDKLGTAQFRDIRIFHFPQPSYASGWRCALMATKLGHFNRIREKDIYNKTFTTQYYNFDMHKASLALPEFMLEELPI